MPDTYPSERFSKPVVTTPPSSEPVSLAEAKLQCRVPAGDTTTDTLIASYITAARLECENHCDRAIAQATYRIVYDRFPVGGGGAILLPNPPLVSVSSVTYTDTDGNPQTLAPGSYLVDPSFEPGRVVPAYGQQWPGTRQQIAAVQVTYVAGFATVPEDIRSAIRLLVEHMYDNPSAASEKQQYPIPFGVECLLAAHRWGSYW